MSNDDKGFIFMVFVVVAVCVTAATCNVLKNESDKRTCYELAQDKSLCDKKFFGKD